MHRRRALQALTGGVLALSGCNALGGTDDGSRSPTNSDDAPYSDGLTPEFAEDPTKASLRLRNDDEERVDLDVTVTKADGDRQYDEAYAIDAGETVLEHDVLSLAAEGETTFDVTIGGMYDDAVREASVSLTRRDVQQEVVVTTRGTSDVAVSAREIPDGTTPE